MLCNLSVYFQNVFSKYLDSVFDSAEYTRNVMLDGDFVCQLDVYEQGIERIEFAEWHYADEIVSELGSDDSVVCYKYGSHYLFDLKVYLTLDVLSSPIFKHLFHDAEYVVHQNFYPSCKKLETYYTISDTVGTTNVYDIDFKPVKNFFLEDIMEITKTFVVDIKSVVDYLMSVHKLNYYIKQNNAYEVCTFLINHHIVLEKLYLDYPPERLLDYVVNYNRVKIEKLFYPYYKDADLVLQVTERPYLFFKDADFIMDYILSNNSIGILKDLTRINLGFCLCLNDEKYDTDEVRYEFKI
jgi:hypothetical protein